MAQLKDSVVAGSLRVTDTIYGATAQLSAIKIPIASNSNILGPGSNGSIIMSNATDVYWGTGSDLINALSTGSDATQANDYIVTQYAGGGTSNTTYYRRAAKNVRVGGLTTARALAVDLSSVSDGSYKFDGTADKTAIPITNTLGAGHGGTGQSTYTIGDILYCSAANTLSKLGGNTTTTRKFLRSVATTSGTAVAPAWDTLSSSDVGLGNVENTKLSTWTGSANITTVGTIGTGTWNGTAIAVANGGTGASSAETAKVNLGICETGQNATIANYHGETQHWGITSTVLASSTSGVTKAFEGKRTSIILQDDGLFIWNNTDRKGVWGYTIGTNGISTTVYQDPTEASPGTAKKTYNVRLNSGQSYGIAYRSDTNDGTNYTLSFASSLYFPDNGYTLRNQAPSGYSPAFQASGPTKSIALMVNSADTNRGLYDTTIDNWLIRLDTDSNVYINSGGTNSNINLNAQGTGAIAANKSIVASGDVYSGYSTDTTTRRAGTRSVSGRLFLYTEGTATATSGLWFYNNAGTGRDIITVPQTGNAKFFGGIVDQYDSSKMITARYYGSGQSATDWVCMWTNGSGGNGDMIGAVDIVAAVDKAIIYSSTTPTVVNGKLWLKPV